MKFKPQGTSIHPARTGVANTLDAFFQPKTVAVIGASETPGSVGRTLIANLANRAFAGAVYPVNPKRDTVLGIKAYPSIAAVPTRVDLAVISTPAATVPGLIRECGAAGVRSVIVISAGFKEQGEPGVELERQVLEAARAANIRVVGPNCLGLMNPLISLNATFAGAMARPGNVAFISQSGALCTAVLDWSLRENVGFSAFVSTGSMLDVGWGDLIDYLGNDPRTRSILIYMETIGDARAFLSAAREVALTKPIIVIKPGRTAQASKAAASHTGSMTGSDDVLDAAFRRAGVLRVNTIADLFYMAEALSRQPRPRGPRLSIVTNAGGPAVLATDALILNGGELAPLAPETKASLDKVLPAAWSHNNPIDVLGDATAKRYEEALAIAAADPNTDGMLVILTPQAMTEPTQTAELLKKYAAVPGKPIIASWMGGPEVAAGNEILNRAGIPTFDYPDTAARMFAYMHRYAENLRIVYETPRQDEAFDALDQADVAAGDLLIDHALREGRTILTEAESKRLLGAYKIPVTPIISCTTPDEAVAAAERIGYPVVAKLESRTITHKTDVGGVRLNLRTSDDVRTAFNQIADGVARYQSSHKGAATGGGKDFDGVTIQPMVKLADAYELIVGASPDPQYGPVLLVGSGGTLVEIYKDRSLGLPPLNATLAGMMLEQTKIRAALKGVRGRKPVDLDLLKHVLVRFSRLVVDYPRIKEIEINPLLVSPDGIIALDARVVLHDPALTNDKLPPTAIRPYPTEYVTRTRLRSGDEVLIRPIRPEDEPLLVAFHQTLGERTVRMRYFQSLQINQRIAHERLTRICFNDYARELALVALHKDARGTASIIGIGRLCKQASGAAEFAVVIADAWQGKGLGTTLMELMIEVGTREQVTAVEGDILEENFQMQRICQKLGFTLKADPEQRLVRARIPISTEATAGKRLLSPDVVPASA